MQKTPLHAWHMAQNAKIAPFAGYEMPIQYAKGVLAEHNWTREKAGLFDVSHMGQIIISGENAAGFLETLTPSNISGMRDGQARYSILCNETGGMIDDLIITRIDAQNFFCVINAGCKDKDIEWIESQLQDGVTLSVLQDRALIALQGPQAESILRDVIKIDVSSLDYMHMLQHDDYIISRLGYTGEDGFEISIPDNQAMDIWERFAAHDMVQPTGLAARDSLRLEMGYPLYGHDIDATTSAVEAGLNWILRKQNLESCIGAQRIIKEKENGAPRKRIGFKVTGKGIAREGTEIFSTTGEKIGDVTSGTFSPTLQEAIGQGYIHNKSYQTGDTILLRVRNRDIEAVIAPMPFVAAKTKTKHKNKAA